MKKCVTFSEVLLKKLVYVRKILNFFVSKGVEVYTLALTIQLIETMTFGGEGAKNVFSKLKKNTQTEQGEGENFVQF